MKLFVREFGSGKPVIVLHGLFGMSDNWVTFGRRLGETRRVIIPDLRNHGQSPSSDIFDYPALAEDILELMEEYKIPKTDMIGHSLGGKTAALFALQNPEKIEHLVIVDISPGEYTHHDQHLELINAVKDVDISKARSRNEVGEMIAGRVPSLKLRQFLMKSLYWKEKDTLGWRVNFPAIERNLPQIFRKIESESKFNGPALFVRGQFSDYITDNDIPGILELFPSAVIKTISGASHWVHADEPEEFFGVVSGFLGP